MYADFFGMKQDTDGNPYQVTKLVPIIIGCTKSTFVIDTTGPVTHVALTILRTVIEKFKSLKYFYSGVFLWLEQPLAHPQ